MVEERDRGLLDLEVVAQSSLAQVPECRRSVLQSNRRAGYACVARHSLQSSRSGVADERADGIELRRHQHVVERILVDEAITADVAGRNEQSLVCGKQGVRRAALVHERTAQRQHDLQFRRQRLRCPAISSGARGCAFDAHGRVVEETTACFAVGL